jgi:NAD(P)-dependent dehydrogenase (short-subunit alcohol dehydrogenase family)
MKRISFDDLENKVCVITGGGGVIGTAIGLALGSVGVKTAILDLFKESADKTAKLIEKETGTKSIGVVANVLERESLESAKAVVTSELGEIDILINGAGGNSPKATTANEFITPENKNQHEGSFFNLDIEGFEKVFALNFQGTLLPTMVFSKEMVEKEKGVILNISSMNAYHPLTKIPAYSAAKSSINNFTEWLAVHFAKVNIRVNAIAPGFFLTNQNRFLLIDEKTNELTERGEKILNNTPMGKFGEPEDLQGAVLYLLSDISKFVTGTVLAIDGGFNAYSGV